MRNVDHADNFSVELYLKNHESFMIAYNRVDHKELSHEFCQKVLEQFKGKYEKMLED